MTSGVVIDGIAQGPDELIATCQLQMRSLDDGDVIDVEPWRAAALPIVKDLVVDRSSFDRIIAAGGHISAPTGAAPDAQAVLIPKDDADLAFDAAVCIGCGACVAAWPRAPTGRRCYSPARPDPLAGPGQQHGVHPEPGDERG